LFLPLDESTSGTKKREWTADELRARHRLLENCLALGSPMRPKTGSGTIWNQWFGGSTTNKNDSNNLDRCRILFSINMVGAGRGTTMLWETNPPPKNTEGPFPWQSEQETASSHLQRNLQEIDAMCATGLVAARLQILVCEQIHPKWMEWIDSHLVHCGGKPWPVGQKVFDDQITLDADRPSPVQIVVAGSAQTAERCHDLKSGFMEKRQQDLIIAPPISSSNNKDTTNGNSNINPSGKPTDPSLVSSDNHDLYVGMKWSSLVTIRSVSAFLQASADIAAAGSSSSSDSSSIKAEGKSPASPFVIPSFVRVSYVSEENSKPAKWRMHGDFFHPAAWEICKDSFDVTWIPNSLSGPNGVTPICPGAAAATTAAAGGDNKALAAASSAVTSPRKLGQGDACGQWWVYFTELQMPTSPEVYANEVVPPLVQGGSNGFYMVTERHRVELAQTIGCRETSKAEASSSMSCGPMPQAVIPLGDLESFLINYTPNTALGKKHVKGRRPGYSHEEEREAQRKLVQERKQLHGEEDIEKALFDYTVYPAALFHKDATIKAARDRDAALTKKSDDASSNSSVGPQTCKSSYYDITITKPRPPVLGWCQAMARRGLCTLYADYFRFSSDERCLEACGLKKDFTPLSVQPE
jgi:hypothetical protein